jgi:hypothetical protein
MLQASVPIVSCVSDICCKCVYLDVAYISHICCKCFMLRMFAMVFKHFSSVFLQVFQKHVSSVLSVFRSMLQMFQKHVSSVSSVFRCMLQVLYLDISKVARVLHMGCAWELERARVVPARSLATLAMARRCGPRMGAQNAGTGGGVIAQARGMECRDARETMCSVGIRTWQPSGHPSTSTAVTNIELR